MNSIKGHQRFEGVFWITSDRSKTRLATLNLTPGKQFYGEELIERDGKEYRVWNPFRSKIAAAILNGIRDMPISSGVILLYLGVGSGTTCSHLSDIVGEGGLIFSVDFAPTAMRDFIEKVVENRRNVAPILADVRNPLSYRTIVSKADIIYSDVAQPNQAEILAENADLYLRKGGWGLMAVKSRSIDVTEEPSRTYAREVEFLRRRGFRIVESLNLEPYEKDHALVSAVYE